MSKNDNSDFSFGAIFGVLLGIALSAIVWTLPLPIASDSNWIKDYQTLIGGVFALVAAAVSIHFINIQVKQAEFFRQDEIERERFAARPLLSFELVKLLEYSETCFRELRSVHEKLIVSGKNEVELPLSVKTPALPDAVFEPLRQHLKFATPSAILVVSKLLRKLQIQHSRYRNLVTPNEHSVSESITNIHVYMADALEISTLSSRLFAYSRSEIEEVESKILKGDIFQAGTLAVDFDSQDPFVLFILNRYLDN
jgi:hypothetical protein